MTSSVTEEIKTKLDLVEFLRGFLEIKSAGKNFKALCPFHKEKTPSLMISPEKQIWHCFGCFPAKSLIKTEKGFHNIEDIQVEQKVLTHKGRFMPVVRTLWRPYKGDMIDIKTRKSNQTVSLTTEHEVYVIRTKNCLHKSRGTRICQWRCSKKYCPRFYLNYKIEELPASQLSINDYLLYPVNQEVKNIEVSDLNKYYNRRVSNYGPDIDEIPTTIKVDEKFLKLIGYYIAEGSNHRAYIRFSLGNHEKKFAAEIKNLIEKIFGVEARIHYRKKGKRTGIEISACNSKLSNIFENLCGLHAENKHIPFEFQYLSPEKQRIILEAIYKGDGYEGRVAKCKKDRRYKAITTISLILAEQIRDILLRLGKSPGFYVEKEKNDKRNVYHKTAFTVRWQEEYLLNFSQFYQHPKEKVLYWLCPIREIKKRHFEGDVYNLTVAKDHSYMTPNFVVGNCGKGGDIFTFLMKYENLEFYEALKVLAEKAGIELRRVSPAEQREFGVLYDLNQTAADFFVEELSRSAIAKEYLLSRGIKNDAIEEFKVGFAPNNFEDLTIYLINKGFDMRDIVRSGLAIKNEKGKVFDRFRGRIMFPLFNSFGKTVGFSGRILPMFEKEETAKYLNSPETPIFNKSRLIYGLHLAKEAIREKGEIVLVEGQLDVVMCHQDGVKNAVGTSGTALTSDHLQVLKRYAPRLILCFDADEAGKQAAERSVDLIHSFDLEARILDPGSLKGKKQYKDPAEAVQQEPGLFKTIISRAKPAMEYYLDNYLKAPDLAKKKQGVRLILIKIKKMLSPIERHHWLKELADRTDLREQDLLEEMERTAAPDSPREENLSQPAPKERLSRRQIIAERILGILVYQPLLREKIQPYQNYLPEAYLETYNAVVGGVRPTSGKTTDFLDLAALRFSLEGKEAKEFSAELDDLLKNLEIEYLKEKKEELNILIRKNRDFNEDCLKYIEQFQETVKKIELLKKDEQKK